MPKIFRSGNSKVVTLPEKALRELGLSIGDEVEVEAKKGKIELIFPKTQKRKAPVSKEFVSWTEGFIDRYKIVLDELAKR